MTKPKKPSPQPSSTFSYMLVAVKVLLVVVIILLLPKLVTGKAKPGGRRNKKFVQQLEGMRFDCERSADCKEILPEESSMCVTKCISVACHEQVYGKKPLEDGEIDVKRARDFEKCVKDELKAQRAEEARAKRS